MSEPTERPPSPIPVPWPFIPPHPLEPDHPLYSHVPRNPGEQTIEQAQWNASWDEFDRQYRQIRSTQTRTEQSHHHIFAPPMPPAPQQHQHRPQYDQQYHDTPTNPHGGPERWIHRGRSYARDNPDSEWVEAPKHAMHPATDIYGFAPGDPMYRPHLRYTPRESDDGEVQREQSAVPSMDARATPHTMRRGDIHGASRSMPRAPSPPPMPYRPRAMPGDRGPADYSHPGSSRSVPQDRYPDPRYPPPINDARAPSNHSRSLGPDATQQLHQAPATSHNSNERLETREDPWEFLFGSKGYVTLAPGDERPGWWDWED